MLQTVYREVDDNHIDETKENKTNPTQNERIKIVLYVYIILVITV